MFHVLAVKFSARLALHDPPGVRTWMALSLRATDTRTGPEGCPLRLTVYASALPSSVYASAVVRLK